MKKEKTDAPILDNFLNLQRLVTIMDEKEVEELKTIDEVKLDFNNMN